MSSRKRRKAAITYGVPRTTLIDELIGRVPEERTPPGPKTILTGAEEKVFVAYIKLMASIVLMSQIFVQAAKLTIL